MNITAVLRRCRGALSTTSDGFVIKTTDWGSIAADPRTPATSRKGLFVGGAVVTGPDTVVDAIAAGRLTFSWG